MEIVKPTENLKSLNKNIKDDFYKVPNLKFDVEKIIIRIPKYTEASYAASQRRGTQNVGVNIPDHLVILKKK